MAALSDLITEISCLEKKHASHSASRKISKSLRPLITFVERYAVAIDVTVQGTCNPAALIWGGLRCLLKVASSFSEYFDLLLGKLEELGNTVSIYARYESLFASKYQFQAALFVVYQDISAFLQKARKVFKRRGIRVLRKSLWRDFETEFQKTLQSLCRHVEVLRDETTLAHRLDVHNFIDTQKNDHTSALRNGITDWLSPSDAYQDYSRASSWPLRPGGSWFLSHECFQTWMRSSGSILWASGFPGSGKTVLSASIISHIQENMSASHTLVYYYCDRNDEKKASALTMVATILSQMMSHNDGIFPVLLAAFEAAKILRRPRFCAADSPLHLLKTILSACPHVYVVVDGVDESNEVCKMIDTLLDVTDCNGNVSTMIFSRDVPSIRSKLSNKLSIEFNVSNTKADIDSYITRAVAELQIGSTESALGGRIVEKLCGASDGMFLWAHLMIQDIKVAVSPCDIVEILDSLPVSLELAYVKILRNLCKETPSRRRLAIRVISWICCSLRPLAWTELQYALALDLEDVELNPSKRPFRHVVLELCCPLIRYDGSSDTLRPVHASLCEYLLRTPPDDLAHQCLTQFFVHEVNAHRLMGLTCLAYLSIAYRSDLALSQESFPLAKYACISWPHHMVRSTCDPLSSHKLVEFLSSWRRQRWLRDYMLWQADTFPLQKLFSYSRSLLKWANWQNAEHPTCLDWMLDIPNILLELDQRMSPKSCSQNAMDTMQPSEFSIGYFERLMVIRDLARECTQTGRLPKSIQWFESALHQQRQRYGYNSIKTVWLQNSLGILYDQNHLTSLSADIQEQALAVQAIALGPNHIETIWTKNELGRIYRHLDRLDDAERMHVEALAVLRDPAGGRKARSEVAWTISTLGRVYRKQRRFDAAIDAFTQALDARNELLGADHPHCLWLLGDIAQCYFGQSKLGPATKFHRQALEGRERVLGPEHPDTLWTMNNLGVVLAAMGKEMVDEAFGLQMKALKGQEHVLGVQHPHTMWTTKVLKEIQELVCNGQDLV